jgi:thioredoxin reductase (NADPH)
VASSQEPASAGARSAEDVLDLLIVGGGPAGTAAAFRAKELELNTLVIDRDDVLTRIRDYAKGKAILPDFGGGDKMLFPEGGPLVKDLHFSPIDKDAMHAGWKALYGRHGVREEVGVELVGLDADADGLWQAKLWHSHTKSESTVQARHVVLALGGGMPRRLDIPGDVKSIATGLTDASAFVGAPVCVIGGGTSAAEAAIAISSAKSAADDPTPVCWAYRGTKMPAVSKALADELFEAYTSGGNIRYLPGSEPVSISDRSGQSMLCLEVDRKELVNRPTEVLHLEFLTRQTIACIGQEIPERFLATLGLGAVTGGPRNKKAFAVSPLLETIRPNLYLVGDTLSPLYFEADDWAGDPSEFREVRRRGNVKAALRDGVLVAEVVSQRLQGVTNIVVNLNRDAAPPPPERASVAASTAGPATETTVDMTQAPAAAPERRACLILLLQGNTVEADEFKLNPNGPTTIGRGRCDIRFPDDTLMSERHVTIVGEHNRYLLRDEGSSDGVFLRVTEDRPTEVEGGAIVSAGRQWLVLSGAADPGLTHYGPDGRVRNRYPLTEGQTVVVGRDGDLPLDRKDGMLSRRHMSATVRHGVTSIRDLKSVNGTFLKVASSRPLEDGDEIRFGAQTLRFSMSRETRPQMAVQFQTPLAMPVATAAAAAEQAAHAGAGAGEAGAMTVVFKNIGKECPIAKGHSICQLAEDGDVPIKAQCHEGRCGSDPIRIISGAECLNNPTEAEASTLEELGLEAGEYRLACVTRASGAVVVELLDPA